MSVEKRKHTRIPITLRAELRLPTGSTYQGRTVNISFGGAYLACRELAHTAVRGDCLLVLFLESGHVVREIPLDCRIVRSDDNGAGVQFVSVGLADYFHFEKLLVYNSDDPQKLMQEVEENPGLVIEPMD